MLEKIDQKDELTKCKEKKHEEQSSKLKESEKEIKTLNVKNDKLKRYLKEEKEISYLLQR